MLFNIFKTKKKEPDDIKQDVSQNEQAQNNEDNKQIEDKDHIHNTDNQITTSSHNQQEIDFSTNIENEPPKKKEFNFIKKKPAANEKTLDEPIPTEIKPAKKGFGFIKKKDNIQSDTVSTLSGSELKDQVNDPYSVLNQGGFEPIVDKKEEIIKEEVEITVKQEEIKQEEPKPKSFGFIKKNKTKDVQKEDDVSDKLSATGSITPSVKLLKDNLSSNTHEEHIITTESKHPPHEKSSFNRVPESSKTPNELKEKCEAEIKRNQNQLIDIFSSINTLKDSIASLNNEINVINSKIDSITQSITEAIEAEDYNKADELETKSKQLTDQSEKHKEKINKLTNELMLLREKEIITYRNSLKSYSEVSLFFSKLKSLTSKEIDEYQTKDVSKYKNSQFKIKKLKEKLDNMDQNLEFSKEDIEQENNKINILKISV